MASSRGGLQLSPGLARSEVRDLTVRLLENRDDAVCGFECLPQDEALCVVHHDGRMLAEGRVPSEPEALAEWLGGHAPEACRIGMETGPLSVWLCNGLKERGLAVYVLDARHAKASLVLQASKTDRNDARGLAQIMRTGWFKEIRVRSKAAHLRRALLASRGMLWPRGATQRTRSAAYSRPWVWCSGPPGVVASKSGCATC